MSTLGKLRNCGTVIINSSCATMIIFNIYPPDKKPLASVTQTFCEYLLEQAMSALLLSRGCNEYLANTWNPDGNSGGNRALDLLHTMSECVNNSRKSGVNR